MNLFSNKSCLDEVSETLEKNLNSISKTASIRNDDRRKKVIAYLSLAGEILDYSGLEKEALAVAAVLKKVADEAEFGDVLEGDPAVPHSSKEAEHNLEDYGWLFNEPQDIVELK